MSSRIVVPVRPSPQVAVPGKPRPLERSPALPSGPILRRKCPCASSSGADECDECKKKTGAGLQRRQAGPDQGLATAPPIVHDVLRSPGQPLDPVTRSFAESRLGHDLSRVRVHTDSRAAESARVVSALAYTVGEDLVFQTGQYAPNTALGRKLILHELGHVLQQTSASAGFDAPPYGPLRIGNAGDPAEREADQLADRLMRSPDPARPVHGGRMLRRQTATSTDPDPERDTIVGVTKRTGDLKSRAWELVWRMLTRFFPEYAPSVAGVTYQEKEPSIRVEIRQTGPKEKPVQSATVIVGKQFVESASDDTLRARIEELRNQLAGLKVSYDPQSLGAAIWKLINSKIPKKAGRISGTGYDANLPGLRTEYTSGQVQVPGGAISWSAPLLYFGKAFLALPAADQEAKLRDEFSRIDKWTVDNFQVTKDDLADEDITLRIRGLSSQQLTTFRDNVKAPEVKEYANSLLTTSTPVEGGLTRGTGGTLTTMIGGVRIVVNPDISGAAGVTGGRTTFATSDLPIRFVTTNGIVTSFTPPPAVTVTIQTRYGPGVNADAASGYGRGTTARDKSLGATTLRVHEGSHGQDFIEFIKTNPFPTFTGRVGMTAAAFRAAMNTFTAAVRKFSTDMDDFSKARTDCVGVTIDQFYQARHERHRIECRP